MSRIDSKGRTFIVPVIVRRLSTKEETWITLSSPIAPDVPVDADLRAAAPRDHDGIVCIDDLLVRRNLPAALRRLFGHSVQDAGMGEGSSRGGSFVLQNNGWIDIEMVKTLSRPLSQQQNPNRVGPILPGS